MSKIIFRGDAHPSLQHKIETVFRRHSPRSVVTYLLSPHGNMAEGRYFPAKFEAEKYIRRFNKAKIVSSESIVLVVGQEIRLPFSFTPIENRRICVYEKEAVWLFLFAHELCHMMFPACSETEADQFGLMTLQGAGLKHTETNLDDDRKCSDQFVRDWAIGDSRLLSDYASSVFSSCTCRPGISLVLLRKNLQWIKVAAPDHTHGIRRSVCHQYFQKSPSAK